MSLSFVPGNSGVDPLVGVALYLAFAAQLLAIGRATGTFGPLTVLAFPIPLVTFMALFFRSAWRLRVCRSVHWRGRTIDVGGTRPAA